MFVDDRRLKPVDNLGLYSQNDKTRDRDLERKDKPKEDKTPLFYILKLGLYKREFSLKSFV